MALLIQADNKLTEVSPKNGKAFDLKELQGYVGGYIEDVPPHRLRPVPWADPKSHLIINEEGKLKGLPVNSMATQIYIYGNVDPIVGDALIVTREELGEEEEEEE